MTKSLGVLVRVHSFRLVYEIEIVGTGITTTTTGSERERERKKDGLLRSESKNGIFLRRCFCGIAFGTLLPSSRLQACSPIHLFSGIYLYSLYLYPP